MLTKFGCQLDPCCGRGPTAPAVLRWACGATSLKRLPPVAQLPSRFGAASPCGRLRCDAPEALGLGLTVVLELPPLWSWTRLSDPGL